MVDFKTYLIESEKEVTKGDLDRLEYYLDQIYKTLNIDVEFTKHFLDRVNDSRNGKQITMKELVKLFKDQYLINGPSIAKLGNNEEAILKDMSTDINSPFVLKYDPKSKMFDLVLKTIMRKRNFYGKDKEFKVR